MTAPSPVNLWVMIDEDPDSVNDAAWAVFMDGTVNMAAGDKWQDLPSTLHGGGCGFTFGDGHAEIHKWKDGRTLSIQVTYTPLPHGNIDTGVIQANNPDIAWVKYRTTAPK